MPSLNMPVQRLKVAILQLDLPLLWARNPFKGKFNHWQVSQKQAGQIFFKRRHGCEKGITIQICKLTPILDKFLEYKRNWIQHVNRMPHNRLPRVMKHYCPTGRRNHGWPLKRLLDTWDRNGSTSGPTPWQIYDDDDDHHHHHGKVTDHRRTFLELNKRFWSIKVYGYWRSLVRSNSHTKLLQS